MDGGRKGESPHKGPPPLPTFSGTKYISALLPNCKANEKSQERFSPLGTPSFLVIHNHPRVVWVPDNSDFLAQRSWGRDIRVDVWWSADRRVTGYRQRRLGHRHPAMSEEPKEQGKAGGSGTPGGAILPGSLPGAH